LAWICCWTAFQLSARAIRSSPVQNLRKIAKKTKNSRMGASHLPFLMMKSKPTQGQNIWNEILPFN
jgi:hypothetical protein